MAEELTVDGVRRDIAEQLYLRPEQIGDDDDLLSAGLDSVRLLTLVEQWREQGFHVAFVELAAAPTMTDWSRLLHDRLGRGDG